MRTPGLTLEDDGALAANLHTLFAARARETPDAPAVLDVEETVSYGQLFRRAEAVRGALLDRGLTDEAPVGVLMGRRADLVAVLLGVLGAGAAYVPLDPSDPPARLARLLAAAQAQTVIGDAPLLDALADTGATFTRLDATEVLSGPSALTPPAPGGARLAYLLFTSGSTGFPKAVEVEHGNVAPLLRSARETLSFSRADRYLATSTISFDASVIELFLPLATGASLVMRERDLVLDPERMARVVHETGVTIVQTSPSVWAAILDQAPRFPRVRVAITHGEAAPPDLVRRLLPHGEQVWNFYGPTETTVWATGCRLSADTAFGLGGPSAPIGRPLPHLTAHVLDEGGEPVQDGVSGELWLSGPSVARGYRGAGPEVNDRFARLAGSRAYGTGDLVRRDATGGLHYLGRMDEQMQIRGVRVEPREIEAAALIDPRVERAAATWFPTPSGARAVALAVEPGPGSALSPRDVQSALAERLPRPMIPSRILFPETLPLLANGKVDRAALRAAALAVGEDVEGGPAQEIDLATKSERHLARIWKDAIGGGLPGRDAHFFASGGDSLTAVHMIAQVEREFGIELPIKLLYDAPVLAALARHIDTAHRRRAAREDRGLIFHVAGPREGRPVFFCHGDLGLARRNHWRPGYPIYALTFWAKGVGIVRVDTIEAQAEVYLSEIRTIQPAGPYRIAGFSIGGMIAFEVARRLEALGESVEFLFLLDPSSPKRAATFPPAEHAPRNRSLPDRIGGRVRHLARGPRALGWQHWFADLVPVPAGWRHRNGIGAFITQRRIRHPLGPLGMPTAARIWETYARDMRPAAHRYRAHPVSARSAIAICVGHDRVVEAYAGVLPGLSRVETLLDRHDGLFRPPALTDWTRLLDAMVAEADAGPAATVAHDATG